MWLHVNNSAVTVLKISLPITFAFTGANAAHKYFVIKNTQKDISHFQTFPALCVGSEMILSFYMDQVKSA